MRTRQTALVALILLFLVSTPSTAADRFLSVSCDVYLSLRLGLESRFHPHMGVRADLGAAFYGLFLADAFYLIYLLPEDHRFRLNLLVGLPTISFPMTLEAAMVSLGVSVAGGYRFSDTFSMDLRLGGGFPFFFESGKEVIRSGRSGFFTYFWPDLSLSANFLLPLRKRGPD